MVIYVYFLRPNVLQFTTTSDLGCQCRPHYTVTTHFTKTLPFHDDYPSVLTVLLSLQTEGARWKSKEGSRDNYLKLGTLQPYP